MAETGHRFTFHIGAPKTGTSALQHVLRAAPVGVIYPDAGQWPDGAHHHLTFAWLGKAAPGHAAPRPAGPILSAFCDEVLAAGAGHAIFSSEEIFDTPKAGLRLLSAMRARLDGRFAAWQILVTVRAHAARMASAYNQAVKDPATAETRHPDAFAEDSLGRLTYAPRLAAWADGGTPLRIEAYAPGDTLVPRLLAAVGATAAEPAPRRNRSIGPRALAALLIANTLLDTRTARAAFFERLRTERPFPIYEPPAWPFSPGADALIARAFAGDRAALARDHGIDLAGEARPDELFGLMPDARQAVRAACADLPGFAERRARVEAILAGTRW